MHINVFIDSQTLELTDDNGVLHRYSVSTASKGTGQQEGSWQTPLGRHIIRAKIGDGCPLHTVFVSRRPTGEIFSSELQENYPVRRDWILTRILWLSGTEVGFNRLGNVDTMRRYVYIHGSPDHATMGKPGSKGCIRMHGKDLIELFDRIQAGISINIVNSREDIL
ncbi:L,D-transpeptidase [Endozoicomonas sp. OPT23]|uniref:L,D-transpeptidase family protein n=1 Tax=Endozoicomonas sp. OPT23 TaxID=2072845 RepID=UPI001D804D37|nr:L,D-transpeptidase [Endozoicomonas sp. OPT23]